MADHDSNLERLREISQSEAAASHLWDEIVKEVFERTDATVVVDSHGVIFRVNREAELVFGYSRQELIGQSIEILVPDSAKAAHQPYRDQYLKEPRQRAMGTGSLKGKRKDGGEFTAEISLSPIPTRNGIFTIATVRRRRD